MTMSLKVAKMDRSSAVNSSKMNGHFQHYFAMLETQKNSMVQNNILDTQALSARECVDANGSAKTAYAGKAPTPTSLIGLSISYRPFTQCILMLDSLSDIDLSFGS